MVVGRAQNSPFRSTMHVGGVSSVWESAGFASRRSPVRSRYAPSPASVEKATLFGSFAQQAGAQPITWVPLAVELQRDWARGETVDDVIEIVLTDRLLKG